MLGGMIGPRMEEAPVIPMVMRIGYLASSMALISMLPRPAASAIAVPDMPAKIMLPTTLTWPRPPRRCPTRALAKLKIRSVIMLVFMILAARTKKDAEISGKLLSPFHHLQGKKIERQFFESRPDDDDHQAGVSDRKATGIPRIKNKKRMPTNMLSIIDPTLSPVFSGKNQKWK